MNKEQIAERKSLYSQLQGQLENMQEEVKDRDGTIETLERQLVQAGIKNKVMQGSMEVGKQVYDTKGSIYKEELETKAKQKHLRKMMDESAKVTKERIKQRENLINKPLER